MAKLTFSRQNVLFHGKTTVAHICHGKTFFSTAKLSFSRQNLLFHGKTFFSTAQLFFPRRNFLFHSRAFFFNRIHFSKLSLNHLSWNVEIDVPLTEDYATHAYSPKYNQGHLTYIELLQLWPLHHIGEFPL